MFKGIFLQLITSNSRLSLYGGSITPHNTEIRQGTPHHKLCCLVTFRLFELYTDRSSIKHITSLINLPKLPPQPPIFSAASPRSQIRTNITATNTTPTPTPPSTVGSPTISPDLRLAIHLGLQSINHFQDPVSTLSISQLANEVATQFLNQTPHIPTIIQLTHQITTLLQRNPSPLLAQASQLYFQALLSPSQQDIINANTNLQQLLTN